MPGIELYRLTLSEKELAASPESERVLYLKLGAFANEVTTLNKLVQFTLFNGEALNEAEERSRHAMTMILLRLLCGRLYEMYAVICGDFKSLKVKYRGAMKEDGATALRKLNIYFGVSDNLIKAVRHRMAFHTDADIFGQSVRSLDADETLVDYMAAEVGNCLFWSAEAVQIESLKSLVGTDNANEAYEKLLSDSFQVTGYILDFAFAFVRGFYTRHFPKKLQDLPSERELIAQPADIRAVEIPHFCSTRNLRDEGTTPE